MTMEWVIRDQKLSIFYGLTENQFQQVSQFMEIKQFSANDIIFQQGDLAGYLFILISGRVSISYKPYDGPPLTIANIIPGWVFGWSAVLGRETYQSSAIAAVESIAYRIEKENLENICLLDAETGIIFLDRLTKVITERLDNTHVSILSNLSMENKCKNEGQEDDSTNPKFLRGRPNQRSG